MSGKFLFIFSCLESLTTTRTLSTPKLERCANRQSCLFLACLESLTTTRTLSTPRLERCANSHSLFYFKLVLNRLLLLEPFQLLD